MTNLAYKLEDKDQAVKRKTQNKTKVKVQKKSFTGIILRNFVLIFAIGLLFTFFYIKSQTVVAKLTRENAKYSKENEELKKEIDEGLAKLEEVRSGMLIEEGASTLLGMIYPSENDLIYINSKEKVDTEYANNKNISIVGAVFSR